MRCCLFKKGNKSTFRRRTSHREKKKTESKRVMMSDFYFFLFLFFSRRSVITSSLSWDALVRGFVVVVIIIINFITYCTKSIKDGALFISVLLTQLAVVVAFQWVVVFRWRWNPPRVVQDTLSSVSRVGGSTSTPSIQNTRRNATSNRRKSVRKNMKKVLRRSTKRKKNIDMRTYQFWPNGWNFLPFLVKNLKIGLSLAFYLPI